IKNLQELVEQIDLIFPSFNTNCMLVYQNELGISSKEYLSKLAHRNLQKYLTNNSKLNKDVYLDRLNYELEIICKHNFADYFLIVQDFINYSKNNDIMIGPGRGSAAGSLVAFVLNIVEIDPIKYNLIFERFLNINRLTMPDIDSDVMDTKRNQLIDYLFNKYTNKHVAHIATFSRIKSKQAIRDIGRVLGINQQIVDKICKIITKYDDNIDDAIELDNELKKEYLNNIFLFKYAKKIMNFPRQTGVHAAGIVIANYDLTDVVAIQNCLDNKTMIQLSMDHLAEFGLVKIDILGLRNLTIIYQILVLIDAIYKRKINLKEINLDDKNVYEMLSNKLTLGIFQFESVGMTNLLSKVKPKCLEDLSLVSAIYRPGASSNIEMYLKNRNFGYKQTNQETEINKILDETYGLIIYQEQIIKLVQIIANFDPNKADQFRVAISKKKESEVIKFKQDFIESACKNNYSLDEANKYFDIMLQFASYGFNRSHSISYALISYWLSYFKYYYPLITYSVFLTYSELDQKKINELVNEAKKFNIEICLPDINISTTSFCLSNTKIYFALTAINGIGHDKAKKIIELRKKQPNNEFKDAFTAIAKISGVGINKSLITKLIKSGAFDSLN
ncbi:MAG: DNA polymerase III subunit alpha, partial [Ureaplasma sp.]|nr:DNA polymerase III subunit alpha [Ureaplasma sp.]